MIGLVLSGSRQLQAEQPRLAWPDKSGPRGDGHVTVQDAAGLPLVWDEETGKNIAWKQPLKGWGHSTPVIGQGRVWLTSATEDGHEQYVYCLDPATGEVLHHQLLFRNPDPEPLNNAVNTYASPSCVLEPGAVYVHFGTYGTARLDPETAEVVWQRRDINVRHYRGPGSSPVLFEDLLILTFDGIDKQFLTALDTATGETVWLTHRTTDYGDLDEDGKPFREGDLRKAYSTPAVAEVDGRPQVISVGSRAAFGYDARTGEEIWTIEHDDFNAATRPLFYEDMVILHTGSSKANLLAVRLDATTRGNVTETHVVWDRPRRNSRLSSPVLVDDQIYFATEKGVLYCVDAKTGESLYYGRLSGTYVASPLVANGLVYFFSERGRTVVVRAGDEFQVVAENDVSDGIRANPGVADGAMYLRTYQNIYKIDAPDAG